MGYVFQCVAVFVQCVKCYFFFRALSGMVKVSVNVNVNVNVNVSECECKSKWM